jgi:class 3 adenylate cyclase
MNPTESKGRSDIGTLTRQLAQSQKVQSELDRHVFNLKTLYDVSKDIFSSTDSAAIMRNFLLMVMGNFGVAEGVIMYFKDGEPEAAQLSAVGLPAEAIKDLKSCLQQAFAGDRGPTNGRESPDGAILGPVCAPLAILFPFTVDEGVAGALGLGPKLVDAHYNDNDRELITTLVNNLSIALKNARSVEKIKNLNQDLETKNVQLEKALRELKASLRKVEILESIKSNLCKFVPTAVMRLMEKSPGGEIQKAEKRDISVLFLDIEGYVRITEQLGATEVNTLTRRYFSVFMDAIYQNNGDVVETAGDGLMVLFMAEDPTRHALEAVQAAVTIRQKTQHINAESKLGREPVIINMGISSGSALVGASKFESYTGGRWTYAAQGTTTNVAARLCDKAQGGEILVSPDTARRTQGAFGYRRLGPVQLKNLSEEVEVFALKTVFGSHDQ